MAAKDSKLEQRAAAIAACRDKSGRIAPNIVVDAARDPASPLHDEFEWDVAKAAERDWIRTACELIRSVKFIVVSTHVISPTTKKKVPEPESATNSITSSSQPSICCGGALARSLGVMRSAKSVN